MDVYIVLKACVHGSKGITAGQAVLACAGAR